MSKSNNNQLFTGKDFEKKPLPHPKPIHKKIWFWILLVLALGLIAYLLIKDNRYDDPIVPVQPTIQTEQDSTNNIIPSESSTNALNSSEDTTAPKELNASTSHAVSVTNDSTQSSDIDIITMAKKTIRGDFGNGNERKRNLGNNYANIQDKVNELYELGQLQW